MFAVVLVHPEIPPNTGNVIRLTANDPTCTRYGYDCGYFSNWDPSGGSMIFADSHAKHINGPGQFDDTMVDPTGHRSGEATTDPNAWSGTWYSLCD